MKFTKQNIYSDIKQTLSVGSPLVASRILHALSGFINMALIAKLGSDAVAAGALISSTMSSIFLIIWSVLYATAVIIGKNYGADNNQNIGQIFRASILLSCIIALPATFIVWHMDYFLLFFKQNSALIKITIPYFHIIAFALLPSLFGICLNEFAMGIIRTRLVVIWAIISTPLNILFGYALLFGKFGLPKIGIAGISLASLITYWGLFLLVIGYFYRQKQYAVFQLFKFQKKYNPDLYQYLRQIFFLGWPICLQLGALAFSFSFLTYMIGWLGKDALAAYQIASQCVGLAIMIPYGVAQASSVLVAQAVGAKKKFIDHLGFVGAACSAILVGLISLIYWLAPKTIIAIYLNLSDNANAQIITLAILLLMISGIIQIFDSIGVVITGALRGLHDTKIPMLITIAISWLFSIPLGYAFGFILHWGAVGLNLGFLFGSIIAAVILSMRFKHKFSM